MVLRAVDGQRGEVFPKKRYTIRRPSPQGVGMPVLADDHSERPDARVATTFVAHHAFVRERLRGLGVAPPDLDDAAQDVFMVLVRRVADYDPDRPMRHWLAGMARRVARRYRERTRRTVIPFDPQCATVQTDLEDHVRRAEAQAVLESFLSTLDPDRWAVFVLAEIEGLRGTEIAAELGVNLNTVYSRLRSARDTFERALRRHRARERRGLAALLPFGIGQTSRPLGSIVAIGAATLAAPLLVGRWSCANDEDVGVGSRVDPTEPTASEAENLALAVAPRDSIAPRPSDPPLPAAKVFAPRTPDGDGWFSAGSGMSASGDRTLSRESRYRFDGERLVYETTFIGDDDAPYETVGYGERDGFDLVEGEDDWAFTISAGETRVVATTLRATREGCVTYVSHSGPRPASGATRVGSSSRHDFVLEGDSLRHPKDDRECRPIAHPTEQALSGERIDVDVYNDCDETVEFVLFATPEGKQAPPTLPRERIEAGEHRRIRIDKAQWFRVEGGPGARVDGDNGEVHFFGEGCSSIRAQDGDGPAPPLP
jgi:RNA polymerase sigma factor (sigma-70 family)